MEGKIGIATLRVYTNDYKKEESHPDCYVYISEPAEKKAYAPRNQGQNRAPAFAPSQGQQQQQQLAPQPQQQAPRQRPQGPPVKNYAPQSGYQNAPQQEEPPVGQWDPEDPGFT